MTFDDARRERTKTIVAVAAPAAVVISIATQFLLRHGVPAFMQDWIWPYSRNQAAAFSLDGLWAWSTSGVGSGLFYPFPWIPNLIEGLCAVVFGPVAGLAAIVIGYAAVAAWGMFALARRAGGSLAASAAAASLYVGSPVLVNEIHAGHLFFLFSMALLPWVVVASYESGIAGALVTGALVGAASAQQQFFFFALAAVLVLRARGTAEFARWYGTVAGIALIVTAPQWIGLVTASGSSFTSFRPFVNWEYAQSAAPALAARMLGYIGGYSGHDLNPWLQTLLWLIPIAAVAAAITSWKRSAFGSVGLALVGWALASGLYGPLAVPLGWLFSHVYDFAFFRELYNFSILVSFGYALSIGSVCATRSRAGNVVATIIACALAAIAFATSLRAAVGIPTFHASAAPAETTAFYRYLPLPATLPVKESGAIGGFSPYVLPIAGHPSATVPNAAYPATYAARVAESGSAKERSTLARFGIGATIVTSMQSAFDDVAEPALRGVVRPTSFATKASVVAAPRVAVLPYSIGVGTLETSYANARILEPVDTNTLVPLAIPTVLDPRRGWARLALWPTFSPWLYAEPLDVFTLRPIQRIDTPAGTLVFGDANGEIHSKDCRETLWLSRHWMELSCRKNPVLSGHPPLAVSAFLETGGVAKAETSGAPGNVRLRVSIPILVSGEIDARRGSAVVLRESYDRGWWSTIPGRHVRIDGFANAWLLARDDSGAFDIVYMPGVLRLVALLISASLLLVAGLIVLRNRRRRKHAQRALDHEFGT